METERICPSCHKPLPPEVPLGLCPECLMKAGLNTGTEPSAGGRAGSGFVPPPVADIAKLFPQLEVLEFIGKGGMGAVYKARQPTLDRLVALKILPPAAAGDAGFAERFNREARALARLNHPNIVTVHDFGQVSAGAAETTPPSPGETPAAPLGPLHYLVMEFVDGGNLRQVEQAGRLTPEQALAIVPQICEALQFAHNEGIVHRDIKPENILLDKRGRVKITDFGIAKILGLTATEEAPLTGARDVVGTPHYMAPEQIEKPRTVDHRADIYSLGVVFYEMLTGELPLGRFAPPSRKVQMDVRLDEVVLHALEKEPELRYQQASQVKTAVETIARTEAGSPRPEEPGSKTDADALEGEVLARDYVLDIRSCVRRGWELVRSDFWLLVGTTALILVLLAAAGSIGQVSQSAGHVSFNTSVLSVLLSGPLMGGLYLCFLKRLRGEKIRVETAFSGFRASLLQLFLASFVTEVLTVLGSLCLILPGIYLVVAWLFTLPLVIDKRLEFWPAMRLSRKVISKHWWKFLGFLLVLGLLNLAGLMACFVGVFVTLPVSFAALMFAYEDIFNPSGLPSAATAGQPMPGAASGVQPAQVAQPSGWHSWVTVLLAGFLIILLLVTAVSFGLTFRLPGLCAALAAGALAFAILLRLRKSRLPRGFLPLFLLIFLLVFGAAALITALLPESFVSVARIKLTPNTPESTETNASPSIPGTYDRHFMRTECEVIQSEEILGPVIRDLALNQRWARRFPGSQRFKTAQTLALLKSRMHVQPVSDTSLIAIHVYSEKPDEAAKLANAIAQSYLENNTLGRSQVEIVDQASPALRPIRPNKPLNLALGVFLGLVLGTVAGAGRVALQARRTRG
jgi:serine/threonine protein kinase/capsular polysaccharide biosynthesis protein